MPELKREISELVNYFAVPLIKVHSYFKKLNYTIHTNYNSLDSLSTFDQKDLVNFDSEIHAIVKITEVEIAPHSTYSG